MQLAKMTLDTFGYRFVYLLHILFVVVGFGSSFVWPAIAARARKMEAEQSYALNSTALALSKPLTTYAIYAAGFFGIVLVAIGEDFKFSQTWISIAFFLFFAGILISAFLHAPNLKAMNALQEKLVSGNATPTAAGPPKEVAELAERGQKAGMYGGVLHLIFLLLVIDMIWQPGRL